ncbi:MAG TPA: RsmE family RNA methyltransferase [Opitutaceae bacterium]
MSDFRVFYRVAENEPKELRLSPDESHHLIAVNRAGRGATVIAFDGRGREWECELVQDAKSAAVLHVRSSRQAPALAYELTLAQALPKGALFDAIVRKATELGARCIVPLASDRSQVHLEGDRQEKKVEKWQTAAIEAAKQCGNPFVPDVLPIETAKTFIRNASDFDLKLIASLGPDAGTLQNALANFLTQLGHAPKRVLWIIGPEGDLSPEELSLAKANGFLPITLGPLVLRCETAAVYAMSVTNYELQHRE